MCGFAGFFQKGTISYDLDSQAKLMSDQIISRGPDDVGIWSDTAFGVAMAHRRLSIIDLSNAGHQPMMSESGRFVISYNGEIYNHNELRDEIDKDSLLVHGGWRGHSDTETLLACIEIWGVDKALTKLVGMFAFAVWDRKTNDLYLARDRLGEKPLYYGWQGHTFLFASDLKALAVHREFHSDIDRGALALFLRYGYVPSPYSIYSGINKLVPGNILKINPGSQTDGSSDTPQPHPYWSLDNIARTGERNIFQGTEKEAVSQLDKLLRKSIKDQMLSDVPLGAFLSGGIDSSMVVALMQAQSSRPVQTFTIGFDVGDYNEAKDANLVASHLRTDHTELYVSSADAMDVISKLPSLYSEPFADSSQIPTYLVSQLARKKVTVALSGDGGDELFCGYNRYLWADKVWNKLKYMPGLLCSISARILTAIEPEKWDALLKASSGILPGSWSVAHGGDKVHKLAGILTTNKREELYLRLASQWQDPAGVVLRAVEPSSRASDFDSWPHLSTFVNQMMYLDGVSYLPDDILVKVDRAGMGVSLETRMPFLDHRLVEFAWQLPHSMKVRNNQSKWLLRSLLYQYVPSELIERPKMGFGVPIGDWLRGPLRDWAETLLNPSRLDREGYFNSRLVHDKWNDHLSGKRNWQHHLWNILIFQAWLEK